MLLLCTIDLLSLWLSHYVTESLYLPLSFFPSALHPYNPSPHPLTFWKSSVCSLYLFMCVYTPYLIYVNEEICSFYDYYLGPLCTNFCLFVYLFICLFSYLFIYLLFLRFYFRESMHEWEEGQRERVQVPPCLFYLFHI